MSKSEIIKDIATALSKAQNEFPTIKKDKTAKVPMKSGGQYQYNYADLSTIIAAVTPVLAKNGLSFTQNPMPIDGVLCLETMLMHNSGQWIAGYYPLASHPRPQEMGSEITYSKRYTLSSILGIHAEEDDDGALAQTAENAPRFNPKPKVASNTPSAKNHAPRAVGNNAPAQINHVSSEPGERVINFGKFRGSKINELDIYEFNSYIAYIENTNAESGKKISSDMQAFLTDAHAFLDSRMAKEQAGPDQSHMLDNLPF